MSKSFSFVCGGEGVGVLEVEGWFAINDRWTDYAQQHNTVVSLVFSLAAHLKATK